MRSLARLLLLFIIGSVVISAPAGNGLVTEIMPIGYRTPQQLIAILAPLVPAPGSLSATNDQLIVTTTPDNLRQIKSILATLDRPPKNLLISVRYGARAAEEHTGGRASVKIVGGERQWSSGDTGTYGPHRSGSSIQTGTGDANVAVEIWHTQSASESRRDQQLRVVDGGSGCISQGQLVPSSSQNVLLIDGALLGLETATQYLNLTTGFCIFARLRGEQALLDFAPQSAQPKLGYGGIVETQAIRSTISVPLGRWVEIGRVGQRDREGGRILQLSTRSSEAVLVKVEIVSP